MKTARTSPRARKHAQRHFRAVPMCVCPVLAPHGRPAPPAPAARPSHYQSKPHIHSRRDARAAAHLTSTTSPFCALCRLCTLLQASHKRLYQDAPRVRRRFCYHARRARTHAPARALIRSVLCTACQPACTHSIQHHVHAYALTTQPAPHNNSLPHASPRRLAHTASSPIRETAARASSAHACSSPRCNSETFSFAPPPRLPGHSPQQ